MANKSIAKYAASLRKKAKTTVVFFAPNHVFSEFQRKNDI